MINSVDPAITTTAASQGLFEGLDGEAFLNLLITQMRYQDPLSPTDPSSMMQQTSQFANVEAVQKMTTLQTQSLGWSQFQAAASMLGASVTIAGQDAQGQATTTTGTVVAVRASSTGPVLGLDDGSEHALTAVTDVSARPVAATPAPGAPAAADPAARSVTEPAVDPATVAPAGGAVPADDSAGPTGGTTPVEAAADDDQSTDLTSGIADVDSSPAGSTTSVVDTDARSGPTGQGADGAPNERTDAP